MKNEFKNIIDNTEVKKNNAGFSLPNQYFQEFEDSLMVQIQNKSNKPEQHRQKSAKRIMRIITWSAAAIITIGAFVFVQNEKLVSEEPEVSEEFWEHYSSLDDTWVLEELEKISTKEDDIIDLEGIDFLINEGITNDEIILAINDDLNN